MSDHYYGDNYKPAEFVERTQQDANNPVVNSDPFVDKAPVDAATVKEIPMGGTVAAVGPMDEAIVKETSTGEAIARQAPMNGAMMYDNPQIETSSHKDAVDETLTHQATAHKDDGSSAALVTPEQTEHFRTRWNEIQGEFVDEPLKAVQQADALISEVIDQITQVFANEHHSLEGKWNQGNNVSTEDLRLSLQHYRTFFNRLVV